MANSVEPGSEFMKSVDIKLKRTHFNDADT